MGKSTKLLLLLTGIFVVGLIVVLFGESIVFAATRAFAATPSDTGEIEVVMQDYEFTPNVIRVKAGQQIRIRLRNEGLHTHEFMVGKEVHREKDVTEPPSPDFFAGLQVQVSGSGMPMGFEGMEGMQMAGMEMGDEHAEETDMAGMDMGDEHTEETEMAGMDMSDEHTEEADMAGMEMGDEHAEETDMAGMDMGDEHTEETDMAGMETGDEHAEEVDMAGMDMSDGSRVVVPGAHTEPMEMGHDDHHGGMVMVDPAQESTIILTIPEDHVGVWTFGCFQEEGLHFDGGMRGMLIVER